MLAPHEAYVHFSEQLLCQKRLVKKYSTKIVRQHPESSADL